MSVSSHSRAAVPHQDSSEGIPGGQCSWQSGSVIWAGKGRTLSSQILARFQPPRTDQEWGFLTASGASVDPRDSLKDEQLLDKLWVRDLEHLYYFKVNSQQWETVFGFGAWNRVKRILKDISCTMWKTGFKSHPLKCKTNHLAVVPQLWFTIPLWNLKFMVKKYIKSFFRITRRWNTVETRM